LAAEYLPRRPQDTVLHRLVREHYATFVAHTEATYAAPLPRYVPDAFERYLACGTERPELEQQSSESGQQQPELGQQSSKSGQQQPKPGQQQPEPGQQQPELGQQQPEPGQQQPKLGPQSSDSKQQSPESRQPFLPKSPQKIHDASHHELRSVARRIFSSETRGTEVRDRRTRAGPGKVARRASISSLHRQERQSIMKNGGPKFIVVPGLRDDVPGERIAQDRPPYYLLSAMTLLEQALVLDPQQRAHLAHALLDSLDPPGGLDEAEGKVEIDRRVRRVLEEGSRGAPWAEVRAQIERDLAR
jgi:putative addiction module component (TIGR02574 family)